MAGGIQITLTKQSVDRVARSFDELDRRTQDNVKILLTEAGMFIQADAKRGAPVRYGVLWSSIYFDNRGNMRKEVSLNPGADDQLLIFPRQESRKDGMDVIVGSIVEYAQKMEYGHPTKRGFLMNAFETHSDRFVRTVDKLLERETKR